jgi:signal transduction histidine kinase
VRLQQYDHERTKFLAGTLHDFQAPLTALNGYCRLLLDNKLGAISPEQRRALERMGHSAARLSRMTHAMLQLSVAQRREQKPVLKRGDIRECIDQAVHEMTPVADDKQIKLSVHFVPPPGALMFDPTGLEQVLVNLLDNACRFTPKQGTIEVRGYPHFWERRSHCDAAWHGLVDRRMNAEGQPNSFRIDVRDSGPGIPAAHISNIFEEYISYSERRDRSGTGLGLATCKTIVRRHHGRVWAENSASGAVFSFVLPMARAESCVLPDGFEKTIQRRVI